MRSRLRRLERKAKGDGIVLRLEDGTARAFETMEVHKAMFLAQVDLFRKTSVHSEVLDAVRNATPESRATFEGRFGPITMTSHVVASEPEGGWVERYALREDGRVEKTFYEGGSEEAERIRREIRQAAPH